MYESYISTSDLIQPSKSRNTFNNVNMKSAAPHNINFKMDFVLKI